MTIEYDRVFQTKRLKIYEIAESAGFSSSKYFVKAFRMNEGITPKQFRKG